LRYAVVQAIGEHIEKLEIMSVPYLVLHLGYSLAEPHENDIPCPTANLLTSRVPHLSSVTEAISILVGSL
jgi:hypothetical protein